MDYQKSSLSLYTSSITAIEVSKSIKGKSLTQLRDGSSFILSTVTKMEGVERAEKLVGLFAINLVNSLNMMGKVSEASIMAIAEDVYELGYYLKIEELAYFFSQLRKGKYGSFYENPSSEKVCKALDTFLMERANYFEGKSIGGHNEGIEKPTARVNETTEFRNIHKTMLNKLKDNG